MIRLMTLWCHLLSWRLLGGHSVSGSFGGRLPLSMLELVHWASGAVVRCELGLLSEYAV